MSTDRQNKISHFRVNTEKLNNLSSLRADNECHNSQDIALEAL